MTQILKLSDRENFKPVIIQDSLPILRSPDRSLYSSLPCNLTYAQIPEIQVWTFGGRVLFCLPHILHVIRILAGEVRKNEEEEIFEEILARNFLKIIKNVSP